MLIVGILIGFDGSSPVYVFLVLVNSLKYEHYIYSFVEPRPNLNKLLIFLTNSSDSNILNFSSIPRFSISSLMK